MSVRFLFLWFAATLAIAFVSRAQLRSATQDRCALDGAAIRPTARVDLIEGSAVVRSFCSAECALAWPLPAAAKGPRRFQVHSEADARPLDPRAAFFVRSNLHSKNGRAVLRAFQDAITAAEHARQLGGMPVPNPFPESP